MGIESVNPVSTLGKGQVLQAPNPAPGSSAAPVGGTWGLSLSLNIPASTHKGCAPCAQCTIKACRSSLQYMCVHRTARGRPPSFGNLPETPPTVSVDNEKGHEQSA